MFGIDDFFSGLAGGALSYWGQRDANEANRDIANRNNAFNERQAQLNREWQERMSSTAWQRAVNDMKKAGINPMLAFSQGGASTPGGASAIGNVGNAQQSTTSGMTSSAVSALRAKADLDNLLATNEKIRSDVAVNKKQEVLLGNSARKVAADANLSELAKDKAQMDSTLHNVGNRALDTALGSAKAIYHSSPVRTYFDKNVPHTFGDVNRRFHERIMRNRKK